MKYQADTAILILLLALTGCYDPESVSHQQVDTTEALSTLQSECVQKIQEYLVNPELATIELRNNGEPVKALVTSTNPDDGLKATSEFVCETGDNGEVLARLLAG